MQEAPGAGDYACFKRLFNAATIYSRCNVFALFAGACREDCDAAPTHEFGQLGRRCAREVPDDRLYAPGFELSGLLLPANERDDALSDGQQSLNNQPADAAGGADDEGLIHRQNGL